MSIRRGRRDMGLPDCFLTGRDCLKQLGDARVDGLALVGDAGAGENFVGEVDRRARRFSR